jgi:hypothetical protein
MQTATERTSQKATALRKIAITESLIELSSIALWIGVTTPEYAAALTEHERIRKGCLTLAEKIDADRILASYGYDGRPATIAPALHAYRDATAR